MNSMQKISRWIWWILAIVVIAIIAAAIFVSTRSPKTTIPPGLVEQRNAVAGILDETTRTTDVDIKPLVELETKKDYHGAVELMNRALEVNRQFEALNERLSRASNELTKLAVQVKPDAIATKAIEAFAALKRLADIQQKFYADRKALYELTKSYYAALEAKQQPQIPQSLADLVNTVTGDLVEAKKLQDEFAVAVKAFDQAIR